MSHFEVVVIGIDCAVQHKKTGLAFGRSDGEKMIVEEVRMGNDPTPAALVCGWLENAERALIALDAPLGWPFPLGPTVSEHLAGHGIGPESNQLFRRATDKMIWKVYGKLPLEVGADRIARTAVAALKFLDEVRQRTGKDIPLAWNADFQACGAIEVYPAATLRAHGIGRSGYKPPDAREERLEILQNLKGLIELEVEESEVISSSDTLDAVLCLLAAQDFLKGNCIPPEDDKLAAKEGWIWVRGK